MASVLLTGAEGFTGRYVANALRQAGYRVLGLVRGAPVQSDHFQADLTDAEALRELVSRLQPDYVVHLAALAFVVQQDVESFYRVNLFGTLNLLDALIAARSPVRKVIVSSSANVYGNARHSPVTEDTCPAAGEPLRHEQAGHGAHGADTAGPLAHRYHSTLQLHRRGPERKLPHPQDRRPLQATGACDPARQPGGGT